MVRSFRKYHRFLAVIMALPLALTILTGLCYPIFDDWLHLDSLGAAMMAVHSGEFIGLAEVYPVLNGIGAIGLLITGVTMSGLMRAKRNVKRPQA